METTIEPAKVVLRNVPRIHFYEGGPRCPEDICHPSVIRAIMEYLGENIGCDHCQPKGRKWGLRCSYAYFMGVMGKAWQMGWQPGWHFESFSIDTLPGGCEESYRRAFEAIGYDFTYLHPETGEEVLRQKIIESIRDKNRPVIGFGIVGPPEPVIITGYDENGDVLIGWSFFQQFPEFSAGLEFEEAPAGKPGCFRKRDWFKDTYGVVIVGEHGEMPDQSIIFEKGLEWALEIISANEKNGTAAGAAAYDAWAAHLLRDDEFTGQDETRLQQLHEVHNMAVGQIAECRWYGSCWLVNTYTKIHFDAAEDLLKAAGCFAAEHELMWKLWDLAGGISNPNAWKVFADPLVRRQMAEVIRTSRDKFIEGRDHIARGLEKARKKQ